MLGGQKTTGDSVISFYHVSPRNQTHVPRLGSKRLYPVSCSSSLVVSCSLFCGAGGWVWDKVSLCTPDCPQTNYVESGIHRDLPASNSCGFGRVDQFLLFNYSWPQTHSESRLTPNSKQYCQFSFPSARDTGISHQAWQPLFLHIQPCMSNLCLSVLSFSPSKPSLSLTHTHICISLLLAIINKLAFWPEPLSINKHLFPISAITVNILVHIYLH